MQVQVNGFSPAPDEITKKLGSTAGVVFGKIWRYCQMEHGQCEVSLERIGKELGLSWNTVSEAVDKLCNQENAYLEKIETGIGKPNIYRHTGKFVMRLSVEERAIPPQKLNTPPSEIEGLPPQLLRATPSETEGKDSIKIDSKKEIKNVKARARKQSPKKTPYETWSEEEKTCAAPWVDAGIPVPESYGEATKLWRAPIQRIIKMANGRSAAVMAQAFKECKEAGYSYTRPSSVMTRAEQLAIDPNAPKWGSGKRSGLDDRLDRERQEMMAMTRRFEEEEKAGIQRANKLTDF